MDRDEHLAMLIRKEIGERAALAERLSSSTLSYFAHGQVMGLYLALRLIDPKAADVLPLIKDCPP